MHESRMHVAVAATALQAERRRAANRGGRIVDKAVERAEKLAHDIVSGRCFDCRLLVICHLKSPDGLPVPIGSRRSVPTYAAAAAMQRIREPDR